MALSAGTRLGPYEILSVIGAGGMGQVYRARDTNLKRDVAIKALLPAVAPDPDRLARFIREARILASLNHPNIALIHGVEETNGIRVFVMELIEGPTLAERSAQGPIPIGEALAIARQITDALEAAHEQGIVHRDLKPANVKLRRDGTVKVLDFGIAKTLEPPAASPAAADRANASTTTAEVRTHSGVVFGTAAYMSPEHLAGLAVDKRTDIWAFGCVLFEMLTGRAAFTGATLSEVRDAILDRDPDWSRLPAATPLPVVRLLHRCVVKDRKGRLADASDARLEIDDAINGTAHANVTGRANGAGRRGWVLAGGTGIAAGALIAAVATSAVMRDGRAPRAISRFTIVPPAAQSLDVHDNDRNLALSPDGRYLVYRSGGSTNGGPLMLRVIDSLDAQPLAGVTNARGAFFSFDSRSVGFFDRTQIRRMPLTGEPATTICTFADFFPRGATWGDDNTIVFATSDDATGLWRVPATGGTPVPLTTPDRSQQESDHLFPSMLPGGRGVLFTIAGLGSTRAPAVAVLDFQNGQRHTLIPGGSQAEYVGPPSESRRPGYLLYAAAGALRAVRFDVQRLQVLGDSVAVVDHLQIASTGGAANYAVARNGTLVYLPGEQAPPRSIVWVNREGREERIDAPPLTYAVPRLSPDGKRLVVEMRAQDHDLWLWDFASRKLSQLTFGPAMDQSPIWTPDGARVVFASNRAGAFDVYVQNADGTGRADRITASPNSEYPTAITSDGLRVICNQIIKSSVGIVGLTLAPGTGRQLSEPTSLINTPFEEVQARISPDGRYLAYQSNESGRFQIYVQPFPHVGAGRWQVTRDGGTNPMWARDGAELFYLDGSTAMTAVPVQTGGTTFGAGNPKTLFDARMYTADGTRAYDVSPDGRFILIKDSGTADSRLAPAGIIVVLNWFDDLEERLRRRR